MEPPNPNSKSQPFGNPNSLKSRFATRFLKSLIKINNLHNPLVSSSPREILQRRCRIKLAADHSMARAVRSRKAWTRAVLSKSLKTGRRALRGTTCRTNSVIGGIKPTQLRKPSTYIGEEAEELKKLVPGGEAMDLESLLDEATHYVKCLSTQVQVMTTILDFCSTT